MQALVFEAMMAIVAKMNESLVAHTGHVVVMEMIRCEHGGLIDARWRVVKT